MGLREDLLRGIFAYGFEKPSAIQQRGTLPLIKGRDTIAQVYASFTVCDCFLFVSHASWKNRLNQALERLRPSLSGDQIRFLTCSRHVLIVQSAAVCSVSMSLSRNARCLAEYVHSRDSAS